MYLRPKQPFIKFNTPTPVHALRLLSICLLLVSCQSLLSQTEEVRYYTSSSFQNEIQKRSRFKRTFLQQEDYLIVKSYRGVTLLDSGIYIGFSSKENLSNFFRYHAKDQQYVKSRTDFSNKEARVTLYYSDGSPRVMGHYLADSSAIQQVWTTEGESILKDGSGLHRVDKGEGTITLIYYENYQLDEALRLRLDKGDTINLRPEEPARPSEGLKAFHSFLSQNLEYPEEALELGIETTLDVSFIVDETGKLSEFEVTSNYKPRELTKKTLKKLRKLPDWNPARHKGKAVKSTYIIPIVFRLVD